MGNSFTFVPGPRLQAGVGPVSTVVANVLGSTAARPRWSPTAARTMSWLLQGLGNGFFNDQSPTIYNVGTNPTQLFVGQFTTGSGLDLVTVNSGSNNLTLISGLGSRVAAHADDLERRHRSHGGLLPCQSLGTWSDSLVVANNGDGNIALFQAGDNGLALSSVVSSPGLPNPSGLALASFSGGNLEFYATNDGEASASLLGFQLEECRDAIRTFAERRDVERGLSSCP